MTEVSECPLTSLSESSGPLTIKLASLWGLQPNLCLSLSKILCKGHSCRDIPRVCPERYRDTFIKFFKKKYLSFMWSISLVPYWGSGWPLLSSGSSVPGQCPYSPGPAFPTRGDRGDCFKNTPITLVHVTPALPPPWLGLPWAGHPLQPPVRT